MKVVITTLTALLAFLLTASVPAAVDTCCRPQPMPANCCPAGTCRCHVSLPAKPLPVSEIPAPVPAFTDALAPAVAVYEPPLLIATTPVCRADSTAVNAALYALTHAFLI